jgi:hypothetical protein
MSTDPLYINNENDAWEIRKWIRKGGHKIIVKKSKEMRIALNNKEPLYIHN